MDLQSAADSSSSRFVIYCVGSRSRHAGFGIQRWPPVAVRAQSPAVRATAQPYIAGRPTPSATGKRQRRWICNLLPVAAELGLMSARICNSGLPLKRICNSPAPQNSSAGNSVGYTSRRCNHFPSTSAPGSHSGHLQGTSGAQVIFTRVRCAAALAVSS